MILVSSCLCGLPCRYNHTASEVPEITDLVKSGLALPLCPEQLGGLPTPRPAAEIKDNQVLTRLGENVTPAFEAGAEICLDICQKFRITTAILKARSPSCGLGQIYDGSFSGRLIAGNGITAKLLLDNNIAVFSEESIAAMGWKTWQQTHLTNE